MNEHKPTPWHVESACGGWYEVLSAEDDVVLKETWEVDANRIVACVNACAGIPTESLTALDWQLAPKAGAKPTDVAKLILKMQALEKVLADIAEMDQIDQHDTNDNSGGVIWDHNLMIQLARDALKP